MEHFTEAERTRMLMRGAASFGRHGQAIGVEAFIRLLDVEPRYRGMFCGSRATLRTQFIDVLVRALTARADIGRFPSRIVAELGAMAGEYRKFGVEPRDYKILSGLLIDVFREHLPHSRRKEADAVRSAMAETTAILSTAALRADVAGPATYSGRVLEVQRRTRDIAVIRVHCPEPIPFRVGQYLPVRSPLARGIWRDLSPALPPNREGLLEFHVRIVEGGAASRPLVAASRPGDEWTFGAPRGSLGDVLEEYRSPLDDDPGPPSTGRHAMPAPVRRDILMVAGGTGLAPLKAILLEAADLPSPPNIHLVAGARSPGELYDLRTLMEIDRTLPNLTVTTAVDKRDDAPLTRPGPFCSHPAAPLPRLGVAADVAARMYRDGRLAEKNVLIAGRGAMIAATRERLIAAGADPRLIRHDPVAETTRSRGGGPRRP